MNFTIEGKSATTALAKLLRLAGRDSENLILRASKRQHLELHAYNLQRRAMIKIPAAVTVAGKTSIERERLNGICKGRNQLEFTVDEHGLAFKQHGSRYIGTRISVLALQEVELLKLADQPIIPEHIQVKLLPAMRACAITSVFGGQQLGMSLLLHENYFLVVTTDSYHSAIARFIISREDRQTLLKAGMSEPIILPMEYAEILSRQFTGAGLTIAVSSKRIIFSNQEMKVELPALQSNATMVQHALRLDRDFSTREITLQQADLLHGIMNNIRVIGKTDQPIELIARKGTKTVDIRYTAPAGRISDQMQLEQPAQRNKRLRLEPNNLYDIAGKLGKGNATISYSPRSVRLNCRIAEDLQVSYYSSQLQKAAR